MLLFILKQHDKDYEMELKYMEENKFGSNKLAHAQYYAELRSGKIIEIDEGFTSLFGYTKEEVDNGLVCMDIMQDVDAKEFVAELKRQFVFSRKACYEHNVISKTGRVFKVCTFVELQNKLLNGHRVVMVDMADISNVNN